MEHGQAIHLAEDTRERRTMKRRRNRIQSAIRERLVVKKLREGRPIHKVTTSDHEGTPPPTVLKWKLRPFPASGHVTETAQQATPLRMRRRRRRIGNDQALSRWTWIAMMCLVLRNCSNLGHNMHSDALNSTSSN